MARAQSLEKLSQMSIGQLADLDVTSVTKTNQPLSAAPGAIYVITHDEIVRSGARSIPEILRLAPNLEVVRLSANQFVVTARGFSGNQSDQNFSNKLLVLIDGRSVYSPLYSGVYWDMQDVTPNDIERIEVISGPGATLWGANAMNGVINIITRNSDSTQGLFVDATEGNQDRSATLRYGGRLADSLTYRAYLRDTIADNTQTAGGMPAHDGWSKPQGGFRMDWDVSAADKFMVEGDAFSGSETQSSGPDVDIGGHNLVTRWNHAWDDGSSLQLEAYYDGSGRGNMVTGHFWVNTLDLDVLHNFALDDDNQIAWGGGLRSSRYDIKGTATLYFTPPARNLLLSNVFAQDTVTLTDGLNAILGLKLEDDPYSGTAVLPDARLSWQPDGETMIWAAASRAVRSPTPFDRDVDEVLGTTLFLTGGSSFQPETLTAYEIGIRAQPDADLSFSVSGFYNVYGDLRTVEYDPLTVFPLHWGNLLRGDTYGVEAWGNYQLAPWWRLSASFDELADRFVFDPGASKLLGTSQIGDDPAQRATLGTSMDLTAALTFDAQLRYVGPLPNPHVPSFVELNASAGWNLNEHFRLAVSGANLLHARHQEFPSSEADAVPRSFSVELQARY